MWIPGAVAGELRHERAPALVRHWAERLPSWIEVRKIGGPPSVHEKAGLDRGEWEAIELAKELRANLLLIDERSGVRVARELGFTVTGTLGVLVEAARSDLTSIEEGSGASLENEFSQHAGSVQPDAETSAPIRKGSCQRIGGGANVG